MMRTTCTKTEWHRRSLLLVGVFTLLFHAIVPYYHPTSAAAVGGYMATVCTPYGNTTAFVPLDNLQVGADSESNSEDPTLALSYFHCPACLVQLNATGWVDSYGVLFAENHSSAGAEWERETVVLSQLLTYPPFLIRGPPVFA